MSQPGLDLALLRGVRASARSVGPLLARIDQHLDDHEGYLPFSGGKDSLVVLDLARQVDPEVPVVFFDSGLEYPETYRYVDELASMWRLNLDVIPAKPTLLQLLVEDGSWSHHAPRGASNTPNLHQVLIAEPAAQAHRLYGAGELWGVRASEARGRAAAYANALRAEQHRLGCTCTTTGARAKHGGVIRRVDGTVAYGPIWDWSTTEVWAHIHRHQLPLNPVYERLRAVGAPEHFLRVSHIVDGSRLEEGRITWLRRGWPALFEELAGALPRLREFV